MGASIIALVIGFVKQKDIIENIFQKIKLRKIHQVPASWDYFFSKQECSWVIITLKSGKIIYGLFSDKSFASSDPDERDLYIEKLYNIGENMCWIEDKRSKGILISKNELETIEFLS